MIRKIRDYKQHKIAKIVVGDLEKILVKLEQCIKQLDGYKHYTPVKNTLVELNNNKMIIQAHLSKYKKVYEETKPGKGNEK